MDRLTTNSPESNFETLMNYAYHSDNGQIFLRYTGEHIVLLTAYMREQCQKRGCCSDKVDAEQLDGFMGCCNCPLGILYYCAVQAAELRERLSAYEDTGLSSGEITTMKSEYSDTFQVHLNELLDIKDKQIAVLQALCEDMENTAKEYRAFKEFFDALYGCGLTVGNYHLMR